jgi:regulator of CtrA degradation
MDEAESAAASRRMGEAIPSDAASIAGLPPAAVALIETSQDLYARVRRLETEAPAEAIATSPALSLLERLERAF